MKFEVWTTKGEALTDDELNSNRFTMRGQSKDGLALFSPNRDNQPPIMRDCWVEPQPSKHLFIIPVELFVTLDTDELNGTIEALQEMGLYRLPYDAIDIRVHGNPIDASEYVLLQNVSLPYPDKAKPYYSYSNGTLYYIFDTTDEDSDGFGAGFESGMIDVLIALLATRNIVKETKESKLHKLGIGKKNKLRHRYTTYLRLPETMPRDPADQTSPGSPKRPHWRRGYIRRQHFGAANAFIKKIWIEPVFVNADHEYVESRKAYRFTLPGGGEP